MTSGRPTSARTGQMRHKMTVQQSSSSIGSDGYVTKTWSTLWANVPCSFEQVSGGEVRRGKQIEATANALFTCRYLDGITPMTQIVFQSETYGIVRVNAIEGQTRYMEIQASGIAND